MGTKGQVPCRTDAEVAIVAWSLDPPPEFWRQLVFLDHYKGVWSKGHGPGYSRGLYDIDRNYTLIIETVRVEDGGTYYCSVTAQDGTSAFNSTTVKIVGKSTRISIWCFPVKEPYSLAAKAGKSGLDKLLGSTACYRAWKQVFSDRP